MVFPDDSLNDQVHSTIASISLMELWHVILACHAALFLTGFLWDISEN